MTPDTTDSGAALSVPAADQAPGEAPAAGADQVPAPVQATAPGPASRAAR